MEGQKSPFNLDPKFGYNEDEGIKLGLTQETNLKQCMMINLMLKSTTLILVHVVVEFAINMELLKNRFLHSKSHQTLFL